MEETQIQEQEPKRKLASIKMVDAVEPIVFLNQDGVEETAGAIEKAVIGGWNVVVRKDEFKAGDLCVYCEIDSLLPLSNPNFAFLDQNGTMKTHFRLKTKKLKGVISQGICFPLSILENNLAEGFEHKTLWDKSTVPVSVKPFLINKNEPIEYGYDIIYIEEGLNVTDALAILKYEEAAPQDLQAKSTFPWFIKKTDEERVQNMGMELRRHAGKPAYITEKLEGSSITIYSKLEEDGTITVGLASRNQELKPEADNKYTLAARKYFPALEAYTQSTGKSIALQGELIGDGIQGNIYKLTGYKIRFFTGQFINEGSRRMLLQELVDVIYTFKHIPDTEIVPVLNPTHTISADMQEYIEMAEGPSTYNPKQEREGIVIRTYDGQLSFKAISNRYLLKQK